MNVGVGKAWAFGALLIGARVAYPFTYDEARLVAIARAAVAKQVTGQNDRAHLAVRTPPLPVFVTIELNGKVVGCRGSLVAKTRSLEDEVARAARAASRHDPRYPPLQPNHLTNFLVTVTVGRLEPLADIQSLAAEDGLVLKSGSKVGIVLPWEGKDPSVRLGWAYKKAGVLQGSAVKLERMVATRFRG